MRKQLAALVVAGAAIAGVVVAPDAKASPTTTTFTLSAAGGLAISAPASKNLSAGTATNAGTLSATLGAVTVTDSTGRLAGGWLAKVISTDFTTGGETADETITADNVAYATGLTTLVSGVIAAVPSLAVPTAIDTLQTAVTATGSVGNNSVSWDPTVTVTIPSDSVVGTYTGTITHSVA
jgi:hypothetical protein